MKPLFSLVVCKKYAIFLRHCFKKVENNIRGDLNKEHGDVKNLLKLISVVPRLFGT